MVKLTLNISLVMYLAASLMYFVYLVHRRPVLSILASIMVGAGLASQTATIGLRAAETGHGPYTTAFEATMFFSWVIIVGFLLTQWRYKIKDLGSFIIPVAFLILLYSVSLSREILPVPESDFRIWITLHRTLSVMGFAAFSMAFGAGFICLRLKFLII